jgi:penicillin-binding protein 1A
MVEAGFIDAAASNAAKQEPLVVTEKEVKDESPPYAYFVELVRRELEDRVGARFYTAGLKIYTTLDPVAQQASEDELARQITAIESGRFGTYRHPTYAGSRGQGNSKYLQGAVIVMDALTGEVRALVGGRDFRDSQFDRATQALRQAGSAFKPFVYATALERYGSPVQIVEDSPISVTLSGGNVWEPKNYTGAYDGPITIREALTRSKNAATVRLAEQVGLGSVIALAHELGITSDIPDVPATALGSADVRPIEMVAAYAAFANGGDRVEPHLINRIVDRSGHSRRTVHPFGSPGDL